MIIELTSIKDDNASLETYKTLMTNFMKSFAAEYILPEMDYFVESNWKALQKIKTDYQDSFGVFTEKQMGLLLLSFFGH